MSAVLHKAIKDAVREGGYDQKAVLVSTALEATTPVAAQNDDLYAAVYRLFVALPSRLVRGSILLIRTEDVDDGVELAWDAREEPRANYASGQGLLAAYDPGEPIAVALRDLERSCQLRSGYVRTTYEKVTNSSSFQRPPYLHRRIVAHLPIDPAIVEERARQALAPASLPDITLRTPARRMHDDPLRSARPTPRGAIVVRR